MPTQSEADKSTVKKGALPPVPEKVDLGSILLRDGKITQRQLDECLALQAALGQTAGAHVPRLGEFLAAGHPGTLFSALLYFDFCFAVWYLNGAMAPFIRQSLGLSGLQNGWVVAVPVTRWPSSFTRLCNRSRISVRVGSSPIVAGVVVVGVSIVVVLIVVPPVRSLSHSVGAGGSLSPPWPLHRSAASRATCCSSSSSLSRSIRYGRQLSSSHIVDHLVVNSLREQLDHALANDYPRRGRRVLLADYRGDAKRIPLLLALIAHAPDRCFKAMYFNRSLKVSSFPLCSVSQAMSMPMLESYLARSIRAW